MNAETTDFVHSTTELLGKFQQLCDEPTICESAQQLQAFEEKVEEMAARLRGLVIGQTIQASLDSPAVKAEAKQKVRLHPKKMRHQGLRPVTIELCGGVTLRIWLSYYSRSSTSATKGRGIFPALGVLGIIARHTPRAVQRIVQIISLTSSFQEARELLAEHGETPCVNTLRRIARQFAASVRQAQQSGAGVVSGDVAGRNVVVSIDGGRLRIRKDRKTRTKKGRRRYRTDWREPKLLIIYVTDEHGRMDRSFTPIIDGTLQGPDHAFALLHYYLSKLGVASASRVLFVADGAAWIWKRAGSLLRLLGVPVEKQFQLIDFFHASGYLGKIAESKGKWTASKRKHWFRTQRHRLLRGEIGAVLEAIGEAIGERPTKDQKRWRAYFGRHGQEEGRMAYSHIEANKLPIGSGAIESAIRRIINLRLKGASIFWTEESAEALLLLRAWQKTGRSQDLYNNALAGSYALEF